MKHSGISESVKNLSFLWLEITSKCNLECVHCYADSGPHLSMTGKMSTQMWLDVLDDAATFGCREVQFIGGEPTLHPDLRQMVSFAAARGYTLIEIFTNATRIEEPLLSTIIQHSVRVAVSFYSDNPAVHDSITGRPGSFKRTVANLRAMISAGVPLRAGIISMPKNQHDVPSARTFLESIGVTEIKVDMSRCWKGADKYSPRKPDVDALRGMLERQTLCNV